MAPKPKRTVANPKKKPTKGISIRSLRIANPNARAPTRAALVSTLLEEPIINCPISKPAKS